MKLPNRTPLNPLWSFFFFFCEMLQLRYEILYVTSRSFQLLNRLHDYSLSGTIISPEKDVWAAIWDSNDQRYRQSWKQRGWLRLMFLWGAIISLRFENFRASWFSSAARCPMMYFSEDCNVQWQRTFTYFLIFGCFSTKCYQVAWLLMQVARGLISTTSQQSDWKFMDSGQD